MPDVYVPRDEFVRRWGEGAYREHRARLAAKKRRRRGRARVEGMGSDAPTDPVALRNVQNAHPEGCDCYDCLWGGEDDRQPVEIPWPAKLRV